MKKVKYRNNNYNNQVYSINYKFDSVSPAGKFCGTALDLIKKYNELAKEAHANGNYIEAEVFRQYAEHYRKIITEINEKKNIRFNNKENNQTSDEPENNQEQTSNTSENTVNNDAPSVENNDTSTENKENVLIETKVKTTKRAFKVVEVSENTIKPKKIVKPRSKKKESTVVNE